MIALVARRVRALSTSGALAATVVGGAAVSAGWNAAALLVAYFASATLVSRWRASDKDAATGRVVSKGGERDAMQVLANGGVFAIGCAAAAMTGGEYHALLLAFALGSLAASSSDSWATELGVALGGTPLGIRELTRVPAGTSGAVSAFGIGGALLGAALVALVALALGFGRELATMAFIGGLSGCAADTLIGAFVQERRWCDACSEPTERVTHSCGVRTRVTGGVARMDNDIVNLLATLAGGVISAAILA
ncbi:MAG: protein of unknown function transrane [Gemmatimonadetes bacterium]|nr:protein of unknown function transrane [Gemmatimonadota bacterium]